MRPPEISAVLVAWNAGSSLKQSIESLRCSAEDSDVALQVVVVDNASTDTAVDGLGPGAADVVVRNEMNAGYGVAAAQGIARATAPWVLLINPDVVVERRFLAELTAVSRNASDLVASLVPEMRFVADPDVVNCRGLTVDEIGIPAEVDSGVRSAPGSVPSVRALGGSSGCCLLRARRVHELGGPEPSFFAYLEDVDLAVRLNRAGYRTVYVPAAVAWHEGSATTGARSPLKALLVARNRRLLFRLHGPWPVQARVLRLVVELGHGAWSSTYAGAAPWIGRLDALRLRSYLRFVRRSRALHDPIRKRVDSEPRATLRETLQRKRRVNRVQE